MRLGESNEGLPLATLLSLWATGYYPLALTRDIGDTSGAMHCAYAAKQVPLGDGALRGVGHHLLRNAASIASQRANRARMTRRSSSSLFLMSLHRVMAARSAARSRHFAGHVR